MTSLCTAFITWALCACFLVLSIHFLTSSFAHSLRRFFVGCYSRYAGPSFVPWCRFHSSMDVRSIVGWVLPPVSLFSFCLCKFGSCSTSCSPRLPGPAACLQWIRTMCLFHLILFRSPSAYPTRPLDRRFWTPFFRILLHCSNSVEEWFLCLLRTFHDVRIVILICYCRRINAIINVSYFFCTPSSFRCKFPLIRRLIASWIKNRRIKGKETMSKM